MKNHPFILIKNIHDKIEARGNNECQKVGLTLSQFRILVYLLLHPDSVVTQRELEIEFKVSHPTINGILKRMDEKELISTTIIKETKQQKQVFITEKGKAAMDNMKSEMAKDDAAILELFSEEELEKFGDYLKRLFNFLNR